MFSLFKTKIIKGMLIDGLDSLLGKIPGNNKKTIMSVLLTVVLVAIGLLGGDTGTVGSTLQAVADWLLSLGTVPLIDASMVAVVVGIIHKVIKWAKAAWEAYQEFEEAKEAKEEAT